MTLSPNNNVVSLRATDAGVELLAA